MKILKKSIIPLLFIFTLFSCSSKLEVSNEFLSGNTVVIDGETIVASSDTNVTYKVIELSDGDHEIVVNEESPISVKTKGDGVLNLAKERFVTFPSPYGESSFSFTKEPKSVPVLVDSTLIYDAQIDTISTLKQLLKDGETFETSRVNAYPKEQLFIPKDWDFGLSEELPDEIQVEDEYISKVHYRTKLMKETSFWIYAMFSDDFKTHSVTDPEVFELIQDMNAVKNIGNPNL